MDHAYDTLTAAKALRSAGLEEHHAEAIATQIHAVAQFRAQDLVTKADIERLKGATQADIKRLEGATKADIKRLEGATKAQIERLEGATKADIRRLEGATKIHIERLEGKIRLLHWMIGTLLALQVAVFLREFL